MIWMEKLSVTFSATSHFRYHFSAIENCRELFFASQTGSWAKISFRCKRGSLKLSQRFDRLNVLVTEFRPILKESRDDLRKLLISFGYPVKLFSKIMDHLKAAAELLWEESSPLTRQSRHNFIKLWWSEFDCSNHSSIYALHLAL